MKCLIVGGAGYLGTILTKQLLDNGYEVRVSDNFFKGHADSLIPFFKNPRFEFQYGDVSSYKDCVNMVKDVDAIIHLAAIVGAPMCKKHPVLSKIVNIEGTKNLLKARQYEIPFLYSSTGSVFGKIENICDENSPCNPLSEYGIDKLEAENLVSQENNVVSFRHATAFGNSPCMRVNLLINDLVYKAIKEGCFSVFQADAKRTFIHAEDIGRVFRWGLDGLLNNTLKYKVYNTGSEENNWSKRQVAEFIKSKTGCTVLYGDTRIDPDQRDYEVDYSRIKNEGFKLEYTMEQGIDELIKVTPILQGVHRYE